MSLEPSMGRKSGLVGPVLEKALQWEAGQLTASEYADALRNARGRFERLRERMIEAMARAGPLQSYRDGAAEALEDAFTLLSYGLDELDRLGSDRRPLRLGRLLLEKGEQEYLAVLDVLQAAASGSEQERTADLWGQMCADAWRARQGEITAEEWAETLGWVEWAIGAHMDGTFRDFQRALAPLRFSPEAEELARTRALASLQRLREFLGLAF